MSTARNVIVLCMCLIVGGWPSAVSAREGISVSPSVSNNYVIPPQQATKQINFDVHLSGSKVGYSYRYRVFVDNRYRQTQDVAYVPGSSAFGLELEYGYHSIAVYLDRMHALPNEWTYGVAQNSTGVTLDQDFRISVQNAFDGTVGGGRVTVDGQLVGSGNASVWRKYSYHVISDYEGGRVFEGYHRRFTQWTGFSGGPTSSQQILFPATYDADLTAHHVTQYEVHFAYTGGGGGMNIAGRYYPYPSVQYFYVDRGGAITAQALPYSTNGLVYQFSSWSDGSLQASSTFYPSTNTTYYATMTFWKPEPPTSVQAGGSVGQHVRVTWTDNPNAGVTYLVYRQPKNQSSVLVATVGSGVRSWTDPSYVVTGSGTDAMLFYYVYGSYGGVLSDQTTAVTCATNNGAGAEEDAVPERVDIPTSFAVANYPNPFNPSTTVSYNLPAASSVKLDVYDMAGRIVKSLVDAAKSTGNHTVVWNGHDDSGKDVSSGVYLYRFLAVPANGDKAFRQSGKLVLTR